MTVSRRPKVRCDSQSSRGVSCELTVGHAGPHSWQSGSGIRPIEGAYPRGARVLGPGGRGTVELPPPPGFGAHLVRWDSGEREYVQGIYLTSAH